jgi:Mrp family chromosome partitioning ATPase
MIRPTTVPNLDLIPAGLALAGHQPGRWTDAVVGATSSRHQAIVVDLPSMEHAEATARMAAVCDAAILVIECNAANREVVRQAVLRLEEAGVNLLGTILNKRSYPIPDSLYRWF